MKNLLDKIKSLDKKILIGAGAGIAALIIAIVVILVVCLGGKDTNNDKDDTDTKDKIEKEEDKEENKDEESDEKEEATFTVKVVDAEGNPVAGVVVQVCKDECVPATSDDAGLATFKLEITEGYKLSVVTCPEGYEYTGEAEVALEVGAKEYTLTVQKKAENTDGGNTGNGGGTTAVQQPTITKPDGTEIIGAGSKEQPYLEIPTNMTVTTVSIPAGKTLYYGIRGAGNRILTINSSNAYVIESDGTRHNASGGKVSFMTENANDSEYVTFQIGNSGSSATTFTIKLSNPTGSRENPTIVKTIAEISNGCSLSLSNGSETGHFYKYVAEKAGTIRFYVSSYKSSTSNAKGSIKVDKILPGDVVEQTTLDDESVLKTEKDANGNVLYTYFEVTVNANDVLYINVASVSTSKRTPFPAADIIWVAKYN